VLASEVAQFIELALGFLYLHFEILEARFRSHVTGFIQREARLSEAVLGSGDRFLLLLEIRHALVELGLQAGCLIGIPFGIVEPGFINWGGGSDSAGPAGFCVAGPGASWPTIEIRPRALSSSMSSLVQTFFG